MYNNNLVTDTTQDHMTVEDQMMRTVDAVSLISAAVYHASLLVSAKSSRSHPDRIVFNTLQTLRYTWDWIVSIWASLGSDLAIFPVLCFILNVLKSKLCFILLFCRFL